MPAKMFTFPVPAGNTDALKGTFVEMAGSREGQCVANRGVMGVTREYVCLQHTPQGDVIVAYLEGDDPDKAMERIKQLSPGGWVGRMTGADVTEEAPTGAASE